MKKTIDIKRKRYKYNDVFAFFKQKGCLLLSKIYKNSKQKLKYKCSCGNIALIVFPNFKRGKRCFNCRCQRSMATDRKNHGGKLYVQTKEFKIKRKETSLRKYGVEHPLQSDTIQKKIKQNTLNKYGVSSLNQCEWVKKLQRKGFKKKYGVEYSLQIPSAMKKFKQTLMQKYGVPSLAYLSRPASKQSQKLFWAIHEKMSQNSRKKNHFAQLNKEFVVQYKKEFFKYDFVNSKYKKAIEYNGYNFHPKPHQKNNETGWCAFHPTKTVKEAKEYEKRKYKGLKEKGYRVLTVWDKEYKKDFDGLLKKCIDFIYTK